MGMLLVDLAHRTVRLALTTAALVYVVTVPAGVQAIVALAVMSRRGR
jgi:hypothetical protein